jgi:hypothetical protein
MTGAQILALFLLALPIYAQGPAGESERESFLRQFAKDDKAVKPAETLPADSGSGSASGSASADVAKEEAPKDSDSELEAMLSEMQADSEKKIKILDAMKAQGGGLDGKPAPGSSKAEQIKAFLPTTADGKQDYVSIVRMILAPYQKLNRGQLESLMLERFGNHPVSGPLLKFPFLRNFIVRMIQHPEALPSMSGIAMQRDKMATYGGFLVVTFFLGSLLKRLLARIASDNVGSSFRRFLFRFLFMFSLRFGAFATIFSKNLAPTWEVMKSMLQR